MGYTKPQDYFKENPGDNKCLLVQERADGLYMVVFYKTPQSVATHPWTKYSWLKEYSPRNNMEQEDWEKAVRKFIKA